jgi:site-specific DNA recombinase
MSTNTLSKPLQTAVIYARVSSEEQVQGYSIQAQLRACREWANKRGYKVEKEYLDEGYSASRHLEKRESFKEMLADAASKSHPFDIIVVHKLDRFSRDSLESFTSKAILKRHKVRLISVQEPVVGSEAPEDAFMEHILVGMAEFIPATCPARSEKDSWSGSGKAISSSTHRSVTRRKSSSARKATSEPA